jgi:hypothetical protein
MTALVRVFDDICLNLKLTTLVLLDFSKAFDSVCHRLFILKLCQRYGLSSYLFPRHQRVGCGGDFSSLAPLFRHSVFSLFIDDKIDVLEFSKFHMYADDLQIYHSWPRDLPSECIREVNMYVYKAKNLGVTLNYNLS